MAAHHPFTMPYPEDIPYLKSDPARVRAQAYDVVLNGVELGSGSIRIHDSKLQKLMFEALGFTADQIADRFGFLTEAFRYGTPPHGGFAFGLDRLVMLMLGADSLRDVIAFPKIRDGSCPLTQAPTPVDDSQLTILGISLGKEGEKASASRKQEKAKRIDVDRVAALSKLTFSADEKAQMERELSTILDFASQLSAIDTEGVPPTAHVLPLQNVFREDEPTESLPRTLLLEGAPQTQDGCFCVPKTFDSDASSEKGV